MWAYVLLWLLSGFIGLIIGRAVTFKVEKILGNPSKFWDHRFIKLNSHRIFYGPIYLISTLWDFFLNLDVFEKARIVRQRQEEYKRNMEKLSSALMHLGQQMTSMQGFMTMFSPRGNQEDEEDVDMPSIKTEDSGDPLKDVEDILSDFDEDEEG